MKMYMPNMELHIVMHCLPLLLVLLAGEAIEPNHNATDTDRTPRNSQRVVRLYSGTRPAPLVCLGEGFQADPVNCAIFYRCMKSGRGRFMSFKFQCAPGTIYDPDTEVCNHPSTVKRSGCGIEHTVSVSEPIPDNAIEEVRQELPSPISTKNPIYIDFSSSSTTHPLLMSSKQQGVSTSYPWLTSTNDQNKFNSIATKFPVQDTSSHVFTEPSFSFTRRQRSTTPRAFSVTRQNGDLCTSEGFMGDSENCRKFYRCISNLRGSYIRYEFMCTESTIWDDDIQSCNHAWAVKRRRCGRGNVNEVIDTQEIKNEDISQEYTTNKVIFNTKPPEKQHTNLLVSQTQISNNYVTQTSKPTMKTTARTNAITSANPIDVIYTQNYASSTEGRITSPENKESDVGYNHNMGSSQELVTNECSESGFMGDKHDCKKFYRCVDNGRGSYTKYEFSCGEGTVWDPNLEACNHAWAVKQCGGKGPTQDAETTSSSLSTATSTKSTTTYHTTTTTKQPQTTIDENGDMGYGNQNPTTILTTTKSPSSNSTTQITKKPENNCTSSGFMGDEYDCKKFYRCVDNGGGSFTRYEFTCGEGTVWDTNLDACNHAWAVKECGEKGSSHHVDQQITTSSPSLSSTISTQFTQNYVTQSQITTEVEENIGYVNQGQDSSSTTTITETPSSSTATQITKQPVKECTSSGFLGDENDCKKFYRCVDNGDGTYTQYEFSCGDGTVWDSNIEACNHPWAVSKCGGSSSATTEKINSTAISTDTITYDPQTAQTQNDESDTGYGIQHDESPSSQVDTSSTPTTTTTSKQPQSSSNNCTSNGFIGDQFDCKKFYRCVDNGNGGFARYEFTCGEGTIWDPEISACNHAWAVKECGSMSNEINKEEGVTSHGITTNISSSSMSTTTEENEIDTGYGQSSSQSTVISSSETTIEGNGVPTQNECKSNGFMGDNNNCKKFYRCVDNGIGGFTRYEFTCSEGTVWDPTIQACNHEWAVENCGGSSSDLNKEETTTIRDVSTASSSFQSTPHGDGQSTIPVEATQKPNDSINYCTSSGFMSDNKDCKKFYRCVDNGNGGYIKYEFTCGDGTVWNQEIQACDHNNGRSCNDITTTSTAKEPENDEMYFDNNSTKEPSSSENPINENTSETHSQNIGTCQSEGFYGDPNNCKKFYRCVENGQGYTKFDFTCGDGTVWDGEIQACNHETSSKCHTTSSNNTNQTVITATPVTTITTSLYTEQNENQSSEVVSTNTEVCTSEGFFANSMDCRKFYRCVDNGKKGYTKYDFMCGEGTMWVQDIQACDHKDDDLTCSSSGTSESQHQQTSTEDQSSSSVTSSVTSEITDRPNDEYQDNQSNVPEKENDNCSSEGFFPYKHDCKKFYRCVDNGQGSYTKYDFSCGEGTAWDADIQTCNHEREVSTCRESNEDSHYKPMQDEGTSQTTESNESTQKTTTESSGSSKPSSKDICDREGYFGNTKDCTKFYRCVDNGNGGYTKYDFDCGDGTIWDQDIQTCNHPQDVVNPSCGQSEQSDTSSSSSSTTQSSNTENTSQSSSNCSQENVTKKPGNQNITCEKAGYYANPNDCKKFYRCVDWDGNGERFSVYHFECGEGTIWDPQLDTCNHEESVYPPRDCSGAQSQNENIQESSSSSSTSSQTTESTTTEQSTTEQTTTQETTTQQSTTTEGTTQQSTTTENTTTQSTTTQSTTMQQSTTEGTTTQQPITEVITTQQSTTTESTTPSTTETTTIQQSTTESTTTHQSTTNEGTTTQQSTTNEGTTTEESTTTTTEGTTTTTEGTTTTTEGTTTTTEGTTTTTEGTTTTTESTMTTTEATTTTTEISTTTESTTAQQESTPIESTTTQQTTTTTEGTTAESTYATDGTTTQKSTPSQTSTTDSSETTESTNTEESTDNQSTTEPMSTTASLSSGGKECPDTDEDQYLYVCPTSFKRHPKYCNMFYQCTDDDDSHEPKIAVFTCPNNTIYDESKTQCVEENKAEKKCDGEIAQRRRLKRLNTYYKEPIVMGREKYSCPSTGYFPFEKTSECSPAFLKCQKAKSGQLRGYVHLCPVGYMYWSISKRCEKKESLKDCKTSANDWSRRWEIPIERKNIAS